MPEARETIHDILAAMDVEVDRCVAADDRRGYFALVYRSVTRRVRDGLARGEFGDGDVLEHLDVVFARRWLNACDAWWDGDTTTAPWDLAFRESRATRRVILQQLLLEMNAHINFDLGIAAATTVDQRPGLTIEDLASDFDAINGVLRGMIDEMQQALRSVSPWSGLIDRVSGRLDEGIAGFAIEIARDQAWNFAVELAGQDPEDRDALVEQRSRATVAIGGHIVRPPWPIRVAEFVARLRERPNLLTFAAAVEK